MTGRVPRRPRNTDVETEVLQKHSLEQQATKGRPLDAYSNYVAEVHRINEGRHEDYPRPSTPYKPVSIATMRRRCNALDSSHATATKRGRQALEQEFVGGGRSLTANFAMHRVIVDHTRMDVVVVDDEFEMVLGRAWLSLAVDVHTRVIPAQLISFIDPCNWTVGEILRRMALPKRPPPAMAKRYPILCKLRGKPTELIVDNAPEFRSHTLEAAARNAGFSVRFCPIKKPRYRAIGERTVGTINRLICENLPGRILPIAEARKLGYDTEDEACIIMHELEAIANQAIAEYNTDPHDGIGDRQPALMFERDHAEGINNFADLASFRIDTMAIEIGAQLSQSGIRAFGSLRYQDVRAVPELLDDLLGLECRRQRTRGATVTVDFRYDPMDISRIHVWNRRRKVYVELKCSDERYGDGMPLAFHEQIRAAAAAEGRAFNTDAERLAERSRRIQAIRAIDPGEKERARAAVARLYEIPRLRQITGNIVHLDTRPGEAVTMDDFIANDRAAVTDLDMEILAPRKAAVPRRRNEAMKVRRDSRGDGGMKQAAQPAPTARRPRAPSVKGGFK